MHIALCSVGRRQSRRRLSPAFAVRSRKTNKTKQEGGPEQLFAPYRVLMKRNTTTVGSLYHEKPCNEIPLLFAARNGYLSRQCAGRRAHRAPPPPVHEVPPPAPHPGWVWQPGHHFYENGRYVWHAGFYAAPPRPHAHWVPGHWAHRRDGYVWIDGHWA